MGVTWRRIKKVRRTCAVSSRGARSPSTSRGQESLLSVGVRSKTGTVSNASTWSFAPVPH